MTHSKKNRETCFSLILLQNIDISRYIIHISLGEEHMKKQLLISILTLSMIGCSSTTASTKTVKFDPENPVKLKIWHYYNGATQAEFDTLCDTFNKTEGKEKGIFVEGYSQGSVSDLEDAVVAAADKEVGADELPNIFSTYADTAYSIQDKTQFVDLSQYFTKEELDTYVDSFVQEGYINNDDKLYVFPIAKSTEVFLINKTDFEPFAKECNITEDDFKTMEGITKVAEQYYEWTDAQTPNIPNDGKAFYGRDSMSNYFVIGLKQLGTDIFSIDADGNPQVNLPKDKLKRLWDNFYVPYVKGYFAAVGKFRSDDVKTGTILAYTGSSSSAMYFPDTVETDETSRPIEYEIFSAPIFSGGKDVVVQQGAGMVVTKSTEEEEYASSVFLKWFTQAENNLSFTAASAYLPVQKKAFDSQALETTIADNNLNVQQKTKDIATFVMDDKSIVNDGYTMIPFKQAYAARKILDYNLIDKAQTDKQAIDQAIQNGTSREQALSNYTNDATFEEWYTSFKDALQETITQ